MALHAGAKPILTLIGDDKREAPTRGRPKKGKKRAWPREYRPLLHTWISAGGETGKPVVDSCGFSVVLEHK